MDRTEYNEICQSRGYEGLTDEENIYMKGDAVVCEYLDGTATVYPHCVRLVSLTKLCQSTSLLYP